MNKYDYIKRQLAKTNKKNDENYIITRVWHLLNDYNVKINTQQFVIRSDDNQSIKYGLIDLYFPQFKLAIEIDEAHHKNVVNQTLDQIRKNDIVNALDCEFIRIDATQPIEEVHKKIDQVVRKISLLKEEKWFIPWDIDKEYNPTTYIEQGYIDAEDNISLKTVADCCNVFGSGYNNGFQRSGAPHKFEKDTDIKRLNFFPNKDWNNELSNNEDIFTEYSTDQRKNEVYFKERMFQRSQRTALFAYSKTSTGNFEAVFKGLYVLNRDESKKTGILTYNRISKIMPTYYSSNVTQPVKIAEAYNEDGYKIAHFYTEDQIKKFKEKYFNKHKVAKTLTTYCIQ